MKNALSLASLALLLLGRPAWGQDARVDHLRSEIMGAASATQFLTARCGELHLADPAVVRAENAPVTQGAGADIRALLKVGAAEPVRHRHVRLICGGHVLSEADNWYVPARLTAEMNRTLDSSETPFGTVVRALNFHRQTVAMSQPSGAAAVLQVKAVLLTPDEVPISLVVENYSGELLGN